MDPLSLETEPDSLHSLSVSPQSERNTIEHSSRPAAGCQAGPSRSTGTGNDDDTPRSDVLSSGQRIVDSKGDELFYRTYRSEEEDLHGVKRLIDQELSEPYHVLTFRYFLNEWPHLTFLVFSSPEVKEPIATIMCKQEPHRTANRGYIGMLSVDKAWRRRGIASKLADLAIKEMASRGATEIALETEHDNTGSLALYESLGFIREKRIYGFYSNLKDAFRLIFRLPPAVPRDPETGMDSYAFEKDIGQRGPVPSVDRESRRLPRLPSNPDLYT